MNRQARRAVLNVERVAAIDESAFAILRERAASLTDTERLAWMEAQRAGSPLGADDTGYEIVGSTAVIRFQGVVCKRLNFFGWLFGRTASTEDTQAAIGNAVADPAVKKILLVIDSPGGGVAGVAELAETMRLARGQKTLWAFASDTAASAAYWVGCQASRFLSNSTAAVGSIGVMAVLTDYSRADKNYGVETETFKSTPAKGAGAPGTSLTEGQRADLQREIDATAAVFVADVAAGRGISLAAAQVLADGRTYIGAEAVARGLVDGITTLQALLGEIEAEDPFVPPVPVSIGVDLDDDEDEGEPIGARSTAEGGFFAATRGASKDSPKAADTDERFLPEMIEHHQMALDMVARDLPTIKHEELATLARSIQTGQKAEIDQMKKWLLDWYGVTYKPSGKTMKQKAALTTERAPGGPIASAQAASNSKTPVNPANDTRADGFAPALAQTEDTMSEPNTEFLKRLDALEAKSKADGEALVALKAENTELKTKLDGTVGTVSAISTERGVEKLLTELRGDNAAKEIRLAAKDELTAGYVRQTYELKGEAAARELGAKLPILGSTGSQTRGTAPKPVASSTVKGPIAPGVLADVDAFSVEGDKELTAAARIHAQAKGISVLQAARELTRASA